MKPINGVKVVSAHCDKCLCKTCNLHDWTYRPDRYARCPYESNPCYGCTKTAYVERCVFKGGTQ